MPLRRSPPDAEKLKHYWIDYEFTVTRNGDARDVIVRESTAPRDIQTRIAENLKRTRFRPSLVDGQARGRVGDENPSGRVGSALIAGLGGGLACFGFFGPTWCAR